MWFRRFPQNQVFAGWFPVWYDSLGWRQYQFTTNRGRFPRGSAAGPRESKKMKIVPLDDKVVIKRLDSAETTAGGILLPDAAREKPQQGRVLSVGDGRLLSSGSRQCPIRAASGQRRRQSPLSTLGRRRSGNQRAGTANPQRRRDSRHRQVRIRFNLVRLTSKSVHFNRGRTWKSILQSVFRNRRYRAESGPNADFVGWRVFHLGFGRVAPPLEN